MLVSLESGILQNSVRPSGFFSHGDWPRKFIMALRFRSTPLTVLILHFRVRRECEDVGGRLETRGVAIVQ